ncbi:hypothetical protein [Halocola ammonii]
MNSFRNKTFTRFFCALLGLYFLNISVDSADFTPEFIAEDLTINDQESIVEIILEKVIGIEDAIPEYDDHDPEDHNKTKTATIDVVIFISSVASFIQLENGKLKDKFPETSYSLTDGYLNNFTPPPESLIC